jgi:hypothetical protein
MNATEFHVLYPHANDRKPSQELLDTEWKAFSDAADRVLDIGGDHFNAAAAAARSISYRRGKAKWNLTVLNRQWSLVTLWRLNQALPDHPEALRNPEQHQADKARRSITNLGGAYLLLQEAFEDYISKHKMEYAIIDSWTGVEQEIKAIEGHVDKAVASLDEVVKTLNAVSLKAYSSPDSSRTALRWTPLIETRFPWR